jgi:N-acetylneuraminate synthase
MIDVLRPAVPGAILPYEIDEVIGAKALVDVPMGQELTWLMLGGA